MRERAHVAGALHIVLAAQRIDADAVAADIAGRHGEIGHAHDHGRALAVLGDAEAVIDRAIAAGRIEPRGGAQFAPGSTPEIFAVASGELRSSAMKRAQDLEIGEIAALAHEGLVDEALGDDDMGERVDHRDIGARPQRQMVVGLRHAAICTRSMRRGSTTISRAPARSRLFMREAKTGWASVGLAPITMMTSALSTDLKSCVPADVPNVLLEAIAGRRMADARASVDIVVAEARAHQLLDEEDFFVGAARRGDRADRIAAIVLLQALEFARRIGRALRPTKPRARDR